MILSELRAQGWKYACLAFGVLAVALLIACLFLKDRATRANVRADAESARAEASEARVRALSDVIETERAAAKRANKIAAQYEQDKTDAEVAAKRTADDLRAGNLRLRNQWQGCRVPQSNGTSGEPDASADDRAASAARIVQAARDADSQIRGLQALIQSDRGAQ